VFTGIVRAKGRIGSVERRGGDLRMTVRSPELDWSGFGIGESIAVNGVCLTAVAYTKDAFIADVSNETLAVTALSGLQAGDEVNLEPALALGERLGGHLVSGHVDCIGTVTGVEADARSTRLSISIPGKYRRYVASKGSVCVDGVSLTVNAVSESGFEVNIIPHTAEATVIGGYRPGTTVNIEVDLVARYLERLVGADAGAGITKEFLRAHGYG